MIGGMLGGDFRIVLSYWPLGMVCVCFGGLVDRDGYMLFRSIYYLLAKGFAFCI